eukprot:259360_1
MKRHEWTHSLGVDVHECYELVSMCINLGANIDKLDGYAQSVLKLSQRNGFPAIEELLMMNLLKTELGQRIENTTNDIARKQGITHSFNRILNPHLLILTHIVKNTICQLITVNKHMRRAKWVFLVRR